MRKKLFNLIFILIFGFCLIPFMNVNALSKLADVTNFNMSDDGVWSYDPIENATSYDMLLYDEEGNYTGGNHGGSNALSYDFSKFMSYGKKYYLEVTASGDGYESSVTNSPLFTYNAKTLRAPSNISWDGKVAKFRNYEVNEDFVRIDLYHAISSSESSLVYTTDLEKNTTSYDFTSLLENGKSYYFEVRNIAEGFTDSVAEKSNLLKNNLPKLSNPSIKNIDGFGLVVDPVLYAKGYTFMLYDEDGSNHGINYGGIFNFWRYDYFMDEITDGEKYYVTVSAIGDGYNFDDSETVMSEVFVYHEPFKYDGNPYVAVGDLIINNYNYDKIVECLNYLHPGSASGYAKYDYETKTLTLNNFNLTTDGLYLGTEYHAIILDNLGDNMNIKVLGNNNITFNHSGSALYDWFSSLIFTGEGTLNINAPSGEGIRANSVFAGPNVSVFGGPYAFYDALGQGNISVNAGSVEFKNDSNSYNPIRDDVIINLGEGYSIFSGDNKETSVLRPQTGTFNINEIENAKYVKIAKRIPIKSEDFNITKSLTYNGSKRLPTITSNLVLNKDYSVSYYTDSACSNEISPENIINGGIYYVKVTGLNYYTGSFVQSFTIKVPIDKFILKKTEYTYTGKSIIPSIEIRALNKILTSANYTVTYPKGHTYIGSHTIVITGKGIYTGSKTLTFKIIPKKTSIISVKSGSRYLKVTYSKVSQATGYQIKYSKYKSFSKYNISTVKGSKYTSKTIKKLSSKKRYYVKVRTYKIVNGVKYYSGWSNLRSIVVK